MAIDRHSPEYLFGQIMARLDEGDKVITDLSEKVDKMTRSVDRLPCSVQEERIKNIEAWQSARNKNNFVTREASLRLRQGLIIALASVLVASLLGWVFSII